MVVVHVEKHPLFEREGLDIVCAVTVPVYQSLLGAKLLLPSLDGNRKVTIPPGSKPGAEVRLKGRGALSEGSMKRGDMVYRLDVEWPANLSRGEKKLLQQLVEEAEKKGFSRTKAFRNKLQKNL